MIVSVHHYELAADAERADFLDAVETAEREGLFEDVPGLTEYSILDAIKGTRRDEFAAVWVYESREGWTEAWGPVDDPVPPAAYPDSWKRWEEQLLRPILAEDPDTIEYTSYEVIAGSGTPSRS